MWTEACCPTIFRMPEASRNTTPWMPRSGISKPSGNISSHTMMRHALQKFFPVLAGNGRRPREWYALQIHVDSSDGLLYAGGPGVQLTWMDAKIGDWVVTPRTGKPVEINALWINALETMAQFARLLKKPGGGLRESCCQGHEAVFRNFGTRQRNCCFDVIDVPVPQNWRNDAAHSAPTRFSPFRFR